MLNVVQELCNQSAHNCLTANSPCFLFDAVFSRSAGGGGSVVFFCARFVLFERLVKLRETAIEQESLQAAYICDLLREKGEFRAKCIYELRSKIVEYAPPTGLPVLDTV